MRRVISVFLPHWTMDLRQRRLRQDNGLGSTARPDNPLVIAATEGQHRTVVAVNAAAAARGIAAGMALARARVIDPQVNVEAARPLDDARALDRLTVQMLRFSPLVSPSPPDGLWIDATGVAHLFGGEAMMLGTITRRLRALGFTARVAIADTPGAAWAWAHYGRGDPVLMCGAEKHALDRLSLKALRLADATVQALRHVGLKSVADLRQLPRATVPVRFGRDVLLRLDQALGHAPEAITPILPPLAKRRRLSFVEPIATPEDLQRTIDHLTGELCADLEKSQEGARQLDLLFERVDGRIEALRIRTAHPSRDPLHMAKLLGAKLTDVDPGFGIEAAVLTAWRVAPLQATQLATDGGNTGERNLGELVDRLISRVGADNVFRITHIASDIPERTAVPGSPMKPVENLWPKDLPRPVRLLSPPEPIQVIAMLPDYPPAKFVWRQRTHIVRSADGPERIFGEWWRHASEVREVRDYFRVENDTGERYWLFRAERPGQAHHWYLHGMFA